MNDTEHNPVNGRIANEGWADVYGKLKNCYARFRARKKCEVQCGGKGRGLAKSSVAARWLAFRPEAVKLLAVTQFSPLWSAVMTAAAGPSTILQVLTI